MDARTARDARRKAAEAAVRAARAAATGPACSLCGTRQSLAVPYFQKYGVACCSGMATPCGICGSVTCPGHPGGPQ